MNYLNTKDIVHGDLSTRNVLISIVSEPNEDLEAQKYSYQVQVADFGLAKIVNDVVSEEAFSPAIPIKWAAIELVEWELNEKKLGYIQSPDEKLEAHVSPSINEKPFGLVMFLPCVLICLTTLSIKNLIFRASNFGRLSSRS
jgi:serine/threonine protein kinase